MNIWIALGRLTRDVDIKYTDNGKAVSRFTMAIDRPVPADKPKTTDFINCTAFGRTAEIIGNCVRKGQRLLVRGSVHTSSYTDKNGEKRYGTDIWVDSFSFIEKKGEQSPAKAASGDSPFAKMGEVVAEIPDEGEEQFN